MKDIAAFFSCLFQDLSVNLKSIVDIATIIIYMIVKTPGDLE
jgi:hypothetical protein